jgi:hypothetical protein
MARARGAGQQALAAGEVCADESPQPSPLKRVFCGSNGAVPEAEE